MKALLDTNVVLDALAAREPFRKDAEQLFLLAAEERYEGYITANSLTDIWYIASKHLPAEAVREALRNLMQLFPVVNVDGADCEAALDLPMDDFEDALVAVCGRKAGVDYIVTRDEAFLAAQGPVAALAPAAFLKQL